MKTVVIQRSDKRHFDASLAHRGMFETLRRGETKIINLDWGQIELQHTKSPDYPGMNFLIIVRER